MATCRPNNRAPRLATATATRTGVKELLASEAGEADEAWTLLLARAATLRLADRAGQLDVVDPMLTDAIDALRRCCFEAGTADRHLVVCLMEVT